MVMMIHPIGRGPLLFAMHWWGRSHAVHRASLETHGGSGLTLIGRGAFVCAPVLASDIQEYRLTQGKLFLLQFFLQFLELDQEKEFSEGLAWGLPWWLSGKESTCQCRRCEFDPWVRKGMAAHSSILAWRMPWKEEPGGLQSMGLQKSWIQLSD